jgi:hypothetical protein
MRVVLLRRIHQIGIKNEIAEEFIWTEEDSSLPWMECGTQKPNQFEIRISLHRPVLDIGKMDEVSNKPCQQLLKQSVRAT